MQCEEKIRVKILEESEKLETKSRNLQDISKLLNLRFFEQILREKGERSIRKKP